MYRAARLWLAGPGAIAAGALFGLSSILAFQEWFHLNIALGTLFLPMTLEAAVRLRRRPGIRQGIILGVVLGGSVLVNQESTVMAVLLAAVALVPWLIGQPSAARLRTLAAGALVLGGAVAAGHRRRVYDAVVLKVLGATRGAILSSFLIEHGLLGALTGLVAAGLGTFAAFFLVTRLMQADWVFLPAPVLWTVALAVILTVILGFAGTWRALGAKAAPHLRNA